MSDSLLAMLSQQIDDQTVRQIGGQLGVDQQTAGTAISAALPVLMGALARNSQSSGGAGALAGALDRDHDGSILDDLGGFLGQSGQAMNMGQAILGHVLGGGQQNSAQQAIGRSTGMNGGQVGQLLALLAPIVMGFLGRQKRSQSLDGDGLSAILGSERRRIEEAHPGRGDLVSQILDQDGDGNVGDDLVNLGSKLLGGLLRGR
ncbi:MAG: DUF937 domain-containing protein [Thermoanaerobaculia bacterium]|nr:DUF937 domain-containing protein [Thermoanaerobaculia bacterium]